MGAVFDVVFRVDAQTGLVAPPSSPAIDELYGEPLVGRDLKETLIHSDEFVRFERYMGQQQGMVAAATLGSEEEGSCSETANYYVPARPIPLRLRDKDDVTFDAEFYATEVGAAA